MAFTPSENPITHPTRESYTELRPFRFWCQKVLPLVYDDSLSYYELLCKVVDYLNKTMEDVDHMNTDMDTLYSNFQEFQEGTFKIYNELVGYVNAYFDELDVQNEINTKLDAMASDGSLTELISPFIPNLVSEWLNEHITPTTPIIDNTLTIEGAGADAKVVGELFDSLKYIVNDKVSNYEVVEGLFINTSGIITGDAPTDRTICIQCEPNKTYCIKKSTITGMRAGCYSSNSVSVGTRLLNFTRLTPASSDPLFVKTNDENVYIYIQLFTDSDSSNVKSIEANIKDLVVFEYLSGEISDIENGVIANFNSAKTFNQATNTIYTLGTKIWEGPGNVDIGNSNITDGDVIFALVCAPSVDKNTMELSMLRFRTSQSPFFVGESSTFKHVDGTNGIYVSKLKYNEETHSSGTLAITFLGSNGDVFDEVVVTKNVAPQFRDNSIGVIKYYVGGNVPNDCIPFSSLVECLKETQNHPDIKKIVYVEGGTHDIYTELGGLDFLSSITQADTPYTINQPWLYNVDLIGLGNVKLTYIPSESDALTNVRASNLISVLNIRGNVNIENIEIECKYCRYAIHDETGTNSDYWKTYHNYKNVRAKLITKLTGQSTGGQAFGGGCSSMQSYLFESCRFENNQATVGLSFHNNSGYGCNFIFNNCSFYGAGGYSVGFGSVGQQPKTMVNFNNCFFNDRISLNPESGSTNVKNAFQLVLRGSTNRSVVVSSQFAYENEYPPIIENAIAVSS